MGSKGGVGSKGGGGGHGGSMATACPKRQGLCTKPRGGGFNSPHCSYHKTAPMALLWDSH